VSGNPNSDRRSERRQATIEEILDAAWRRARAEGLTGFSLRDIARDVGMRPQSLYSYFDSKHAIYDAMFAQGCRQFVAGQARWQLTGDALADLRVMARYFLDFCTADPVRFQLMFQRTIPGFEPSPESFAISVESLASAQAHLASIGITDPAALDLFTAVGMGLADQQISNDPGGDRWTRLIDEATEMYFHHVTRHAPLTVPTHEEHAE
jgi:AcrR family transcriptional regulator